MKVVCRFLLLFLVSVVQADPVVERSDDPFLTDKARSCLDARGNRVDRDFTENNEDCIYRTDHQGRFYMDCEITFMTGVQTTTPTGQTFPAKCGNEHLDRDCESEEVVDWLKSVFINIDGPNSPEDGFCGISENYRQTLSGSSGSKSYHSTSSSSGSKSSKSYHSTGGSSRSKSSKTLTQNDDGSCTCKETWTTCRLKGDCGVLRRFEDTGGGEGEAGCEVKKCREKVCAWDPFCCGDFDGWWDRFCIAYAGEQKECCKGGPK